MTTNEKVDQSGADERALQLSRQIMAIVNGTWQPGGSVQIQAKIQEAITAALQAQLSSPANPNAIYERALNADRTHWEQISKSQYDLVKTNWKRVVYATPADMPASDAPYDEKGDVLRLSRFDWSHLRAEAAKKVRDQAVTPAYCAWLDEQAAKGVEAHGGNEIWNAATNAAISMSQWSINRTASPIEEWCIEHLPSGFIVFVGDTHGAAPIEDQFGRFVRDYVASTTIMQDEGNRDS